MLKRHSRPLCEMPPVFTQSPPESINIWGALKHSLKEQTWEESLEWEEYI